MNDFIKQQKELGRNSATAFIFNQVNEPNERYEFSSKDLDTLISQIITNTGEELMRLADEPKFWSEFKSNEFLEGRVDAIEDQLEHITSVTGVERD